MKVSIANGCEAPARTSLEALGLPLAGGSKFGSSKVKTLLSCPREYALQESGVRSAKPVAAFDVGTLVHLGLETYYRLLMKHQAGHSDVGSDDYFWGGHLEFANQAIESLDVVAESEGWDDVYQQVVACLEAYFDAYWRRDRWTIVAVEEGLCWDGEQLSEGHPHHFRYSSRLDLVIKDGDGLWLVEHKTAKTISASLLDHYSMDLQIMGHQWLWEHCVNTAKYGVASGVLVNLITKHKQPRVDRVKVSPSADHLREFEAMMRTIPIRREHYESMGWPKSLSHCAGSARGYGKCSYYTLCHDFPQTPVEAWGSDFELPEGFTKNDA